MKKKKVALIYSGCIKNYDKVFNSIKKNLIENNNEYNFNFFLTFWDITGKYLKGHKFYSNKEIVDYLDNKSKITDKDIDNIKNIFNTKNIFTENYSLSKPIILEKAKKLIEIYKRDYGRIFGYCSMFYMIYKAFINFKNSKKDEYDIVIRIRYDLEIKSPINLNNLNYNEIICQSYQVNDLKINNITNDQFFISNYNNMEKISNLFNNLFEIAKVTSEKYKTRHNIFPEFLLTEYINYLFIKIKFVKISLNLFR